MIEVQALLLFKMCGSLYGLYIRRFRRCGAAGVGVSTLAMQDWYVSGSSGISADVLSGDQAPVQTEIFR